MLIDHDFEIMMPMETPDRTGPALSADEVQARREIHEQSRHSLRLEGLEGFLTPEDDAEAEAWIRGEITLEKAIENTLQKIRNGFL